PRSTLFPYTTLFRSLAHIPPNSAHSNGRVERVNLTLTDNLRSCYNDAQNKIKNWAKVASRVVDTYNHSIHGVTKYAPINRVIVRDRKSTRLNSSHVS